jgi:hypothetical protein
MTLPNDVGFKEVKDEAPRDYVWVFIAIFVCFILCAAAIFCSLGLWTIQDNLTNVDEISATEPAIVDIREEVNADPTWQLLVSDEFNDNKNEWYLEPYKDDNVSLNRSIENGVYIWDYQSTGDSSFWDFPSSMPLLKDFVATVEIKHVAGNLDEKFGFIVRASLDRKYYLLQITESGSILFQSNLLGSNDHSKTLFEGTSSAVKAGAPNIITVKASGEHFVFYVNNQWAGEARDGQIKEGYVGVLTSTSGEPAPPFQSISHPNSKPEQQTYSSRYEVDNFKVWIPKLSVPTPTFAPDEPDILTPQDGKIVYVSDMDGNSEIYTINSNGTDVERLTKNSVDDLSPKWSFDGDRIAFVSTRDGNPEIYTMNSNGGEVIRITDHAADDLDPAWSPDGRSIVFSSNRDGNYELYIYSLETKALERITESPADDRYPDWSPKNGMLLYQSEEYGVTTLYTLKLSTKESTRIAPRLSPFGDSNADFSTSGSSIVYTTGHTKNQTGIMIYHLDTKKSADVVFASVNQSIYSVANLFPTWSADDTQIAFTSDRGSQTDIYITGSDGKSIFRVTETEANEWDLDWAEK